MATPLEIVRIVLGALYLLVVPGLAWSFLFFRKTRPIDASQETEGIDWIERVAIAFGLSIALVPLTIFLSNFFLKVPINVATAILLVALLTAAPLVYIYLERAGKLPWAKKPQDAGSG